MKTTVITRFWYKGQVTPLKMELLQNCYIKGLASQIDKDFNVVILIHPNSKQQIMNADWKDINVSFVETARITKVVKEGDGNRYIYNCESEIQIRIDADDLVSENYIKTIKEIFEKTQSEKCILSFQPLKFNYITKEIYNHQRQYSTRAPSMFLALYQKIPDISVYETGHDVFSRLVKDSLYMNIPGICYLTIHNENMTSKP